MSIEELKQDINATLVKLAESPPTTIDNVTQFLRMELVPLMQAVVDEIDEIDSAVGDIVHGSEDVLHSESAAVFAGIIASGTVIATELAQRAGNDKRLQGILKEFHALCKEGTALLAEIVLEDEEEDDGEEEEDDADAAKPGAEIGGES